LIGLYRGVTPSILFPVDVRLHIMQFRRIRARASAYDPYGGSVALVLAYAVFHAALSQGDGFHANSASSFSSFRRQQAVLAAAASSAARLLLR
jgi:hypothetical protein